MNPISHLLIAWMIANLFSLQLKERRFCLIIGVISDIDGFFVLFSRDLFFQYHHTFGHALIFGILLAIIFTIFSENKGKAFPIFAFAFILHLIADIFGTDWAVYPFLPFSNIGFSAHHYLSNHIIYNVIDPIIFVLLLVFSIVILTKKKRTPIEFASKKWDSIISNFIVLPFKEKCELCRNRAFFACQNCEKHVCMEHIGSDLSFLCQDCHSKPVG